MKIGRNDPCTCGSGKKYKKCCLPKDEQEVIAARKARQAQSAAPKPSSRPSPQDVMAWDDEPEIDETMDAPNSAINRCWDAFEGADYEGKIRVFLQTLEEPDVLDDELAFDMLIEVYSASIKRNERARVGTLLDAFQSRLPDVYEALAPDYLAWRIENALALAQHDGILPLAKALGERADRNFDLFVVVHDQLAYHGQLAALMETMRFAYPKVRDNDRILEWGREEFASRARKYMMFDYLEHTAAPDPGDPEFLKALQPYGPIDPKTLATVIGHLSGQRRGQWTLEDFEQDSTVVQQTVDVDDPRDDTAAATATGRISLLGLEFIDHLHRRFGMSYTKADLGGSELCGYLAKRNSGELARPSRSAQSVSRRKTKATPYPLCPDVVSLRRYLAKEAGFLLQKQYALGAALELVPAWLSYLQMRRLIDEAERSSAIATLRPLCEEQIDLFERASDDPLPPQNLKSAFELEAY